MNKKLFIIMLFAVSVAAQGITPSKDSLKIYNNPVSSFADNIFLINGTSGAVYLDSAFVQIDQMDTTGSGEFGGLANRLLMSWSLEKPSRKDLWSLEKLADDTWRLKPAASSSSIRPSVDFSAPGETLSIGFVEVGTCLGCSGIPTWYPPYFAGKLIFHFSNSQTVVIRLYSSDLRKTAIEYQPCTDFFCDSMNVRKILDLNGMPAVPVNQVANVTGGRITNLTLQYNLAAAISLPKPCTVLPAEIGNLTALKSIYAIGNNFDSIPSAIGRCISLQTFIASDNGISELPESIGNCPLTYISLDKNRLIYLPESFGSLKKLFELSITNNQLVTLPTSLVLLDSLKCIFIANNRICSLPDTLQNWLINLRKKMYCARYEPEWPDSQNCTTPIQQHRFQGKALHPSFTSIYYSNEALIIENLPEQLSKLQIGVFDISGRSIKSIEIAGPFSAGASIRMPLGKLSAGVYYAALLSGDKIVSSCRVAVER